MSAPANCPVSDLDPFALDFLEDPYPFHDDLREAGPIVWPEKYGSFAMARYQQVRAALTDWETYCSSRGVGHLLARLEAQVLLKSLIERVERIELVGEPKWRLNNTLHGVDSLPVKLSA